MILYLQIKTIFKPNILTKSINNKNNNKAKIKNSSIKIIIKNT